MMEGRARIEAALSSEGTPEIPVVICYESIYIRDHWDQLTAHPWWYQYAPDLERQLRWRDDVIKAIGQDWFRLPLCTSRRDRRCLSIEERREGVFLVDAGTGTATPLRKPKTGGWKATEGVESVRPQRIIESVEQIEATNPLPAAFASDRMTEEGRGDLAAEMLAGCGSSLFPIRHIVSPLWQCYSLWGFEEMMVMIATRPDLVHHACECYLECCLSEAREAAALGAAGIWIEDCLTDMLHPDAFATLNVPYVSALVEEVRAQGMVSVYYYCGDPTGKWDHLLSAGADALALEESKKGFVIDVDDAVDRVGARCALLGNLDALSLLETGNEDALRAEIARQIAAGRRNGSRFMMSIGSPVTPNTTPDQVRLYCALAHELGRH